MHLTCRSSEQPPIGAIALLSQRADAPFIEAVADRIRAVVCREPRHTLDATADRLCVSVEELRTLLVDNARHADLRVVLDVAAALVHEYAIDPKWLLTGQYDGTMHRQALILGEDRSRVGREKVRELVQALYDRLRERRLYLALPPTLEALREKVASLLAPR